MEWSQISKKLSEETKKFEKLAKLTAKDTKQENIHKLRVTSRRLRTALTLAQATDVTLVPKKLRRKLKELQDVLGEARTLDVAAQDAMEFSLDPEKLNKKRKRSHKIVQKILNASDRKKIVKTLVKTTEKISRLDPQTPIARLMKIEMSLREALEHPPVTEEQRHDLRITMKKARYILEGAGKPPEVMKELQAVLGRTHDLEILREIYGDQQDIIDVEKTELEKAKPILRPAIQAALDALIKELH